MARHRSIFRRSSADVHPGGCRRRTSTGSDAAGDAKFSMRAEPEWSSARRPDCRGGRTGCVARCASSCLPRQRRRAPLSCRQMPRDEAGGYVQVGHRIVRHALRRAPPFGFIAAIHQDGAAMDPAAGGHVVQDIAAPSTNAAAKSRAARKPASTMPIRACGRCRLVRKAARVRPDDAGNGKTRPVPLRAAGTAPPAGSAPRATPLPENIPGPPLADSISPPAAGRSGRGGAGRRQRLPPNACGPDRRCTARSPAACRPCRAVPHPCPLRWPGSGP